jgi:hypothetical protein
MKDVQKNQPPCKKNASVNECHPPRNSKIVRSDFVFRPPSLKAESDAPMFTAFGAKALHAAVTGASFTLTIWWGSVEHFHQRLLERLFFACMLTKQWTALTMQRELGAWAVEEFPNPDGTRRPATRRSFWGG